MLSLAAVAQEADQTYTAGRDAYNDAYALHRQGKHMEAVAGLLEMADTYPAHELTDNSLYQAAQAAGSAKNYQAVANAYQRLLADCPGSGYRVTAATNLASTYLTLKQPAKAAAVYERLAGEEFEGYSGRDSVLQSAIGALRTAKDYEGALRLIEKSADVIPAAGANYVSILGYKVEVLLAMGREDDAIAAIDDIAEQYPGDQTAAAIYRRLGDSFNREKKYAKAAAMFVKGTEYPAYSYFLSSYTSAISALRSAKDNERAMRLIEKALKAVPRTSPVYVGVLSYKVDTARDLGQLDQALAAADEMAKMYPGDAVVGYAYRRLADYFNGKREYQKAAELYLKCTASPAYSYAVTSYSNAIGALRNAKANEIVLREVDKAFKAKPKNGPTWVGILSYKVDAARDLGQVDKAVAAANEMAKLFPGEQAVASAYWRIGDHLSRQKEYAKAAEMYLKAAAYPASGYVLSAYASAISALRSGKDNEGALRLVERARQALPKAGPAYVSILNYKVDASLALSRADSAVAAADEMAELYPDDYSAANAYRRIADNLNGKKEYVKAAAMYLKCTEYPAYTSGLSSFSSAVSALMARKPPDIAGALLLYRRYIDEHPEGAQVHEIYQKLAQVYHGAEADRYMEIETCKEFVGKFAKSIYLDQMLMALANAYRAGEEFDQAEAAYLQLIERTPDSELAPQAMYYLAEVYLSRGDTDKAKAAFQRLVMEKSGFSYSTQAASRLAKMQ